MPHLFNADYHIAYWGIVLNHYRIEYFFPLDIYFPPFQLPFHLFSVSSMNKEFTGEGQQLHHLFTSSD